MNLFKKVACFSDIHFGLKSNSMVHNQDCEQFVDWFIQKAQDEGCETGIFLGDYHHNRSNLSIITMDHSIRALEKLGKAFDNFYFFLGNHDLYFKDKRDIHSAVFGKFIPGITVIDTPSIIGNVRLCPWLVNDEWKHIDKKGAKYIFGHFELPTFYMNAMVQMPDHGELQLKNFENYEMGFSGHFHKRQSRGNMHYIGNAFPHNYSDVDDEERGMMILEWDGQPEYHAWPKQPTYKVISLKRLLDIHEAGNPDNIIKENQHLKVNSDIDISFEEAGFLKDELIKKYNLRELTLIPPKVEVEVSTIDIQSFQSIDSIVCTQLSNIESSDTFDKNILISIYNSL